MNAKTTLTAFAIALLLAACGNKGPLVMPQKPVPVEQEIPAPPPADATPAPPAEPVDADKAADPADPAAVPTDGGNG